MENLIRLKDGSEVLIRELKPDDIGRSVEFFRELPEEDRAYLRTDVTNRDIVARRIRSAERAGMIRLVGVVDDTIVADGSLEVEKETWKEHIAELRLIVARPYQHKGLGKLMARELYHLAASKRVEEIVVKIMGPQLRAQTIFKKLGFHEDAVFHDYVKDISGVRRDLVVMRCDLEGLWQKIGDHTAASDWQRMR